MMKNLDDMVTGVASVAIAGHVNPDGDCVGSCMAVYHYLRDNHSDIRTQVYLEEMRPVFGHLSDLDQIRRLPEPGETCDLLILLDVSSLDRIGAAGELFARAKKTVCIDHHITNPGLADENHIVPDASSTC